MKIISYTTDNLLVWDAGQGIGFPYNGSAPDMGAFEYDAGASIEPGFDISSNKIHLLSNYPNPFNLTTKISFNISRKDTENAKIEIYNIKGQKIKTFSNLQINKSLNQQVIWDGTDENNKLVSSGIYFYKLKINDTIVLTKKCLLLK